MITLCLGAAVPLSRSVRVFYCSRWCTGLVCSLGGDLLGMGFGVFFHGRVLFCFRLGS